MNRTVTTLFLLMSLDGKTSTGAVDDRDAVNVSFTAYSVVVS